MSRLALSILSVLLSASIAHGSSCADYGLVGQQPWVAYGGVNLGNGLTVANPPTAGNGLRGEVASFPYVVPTGKVLFFESVTIETLWGVVMWPSIGPLQYAPINALDTYTAAALDSPTRGTTRQFNAGFQIPAGQSLNITFAAVPGWPAGGPWQVEWSMHGFLCAVPN